MHSYSNFLFPFPKILPQNLSSAADIILKGAKRMETAVQERVDQKLRQGQQQEDFHSELIGLRQKWRLKKTGASIMGDLTYRSGILIIIFTEGRDLLDLITRYNAVCAVGSCIVVPCCPILCHVSSLYCALLCCALFDILYHVLFVPCCSICALCTDLLCAFPIDAMTCFVML